MTKADLLARAAELSIEGLSDSDTKPHIEATIAAAEAAAEAADKTPLTPLQKAQAQAAELGLTDFDDLDLATLQLRIDEASDTEDTVKLRVKKDVVTLRCIAVDAGEYEMTAHELAATGLEPRHYELLSEQPTT